MKTKDKTFEDGMFYFIKLIRDGKLATFNGVKYILDKDELKRFERYWLQKREKR